MVGLEVTLVGSLSPFILQPKVAGQAKHLDISI